MIGHGKDDADAKVDVATYRFNHTMIRVKDPTASLKFYTDILGMQLVRKAEMKEAKFDLYFLSYPKTLPSGHKLVATDKNGVNPLAEAEGILELTHNYGSETKEGQVYTNGNDTEFNGKEVKQGFGHICEFVPRPRLISGISVDNIDAACARFDEMGVSWKKKLTDGRMKSIAFVLDPDNYWVEVIAQ